MSNTKYKDGIASGVPKDVAVAQKYGERVSGTGNIIQVVELHNCGIVYAADHPYALCVMTKGVDINKLTLVLKDISKIVYNYVQSSLQNQKTYN